MAEVVAVILFIEVISALDICCDMAVAYLEFLVWGETDEFAPGQRLESQSILAGCRVG